MKTMNFSEARSHFKQLCDTVTKNSQETIITRRDADSVVVMSLENYNILQESAYLMRNSVNAKRLLDAVEQLEAGEGQEHSLDES